jgi:NADH-quinone oxidoreductase subunit E
MSESVVEVILWILLVFFIGCILGYVLRWVVSSGRRGITRSPFHGTSDEEDRPQAAKIAELKVPTVPVQAASKPEPAVNAAGSAGSASKAAVATPKPAKPAANGAQPKGLPAPRGGTPDPLQKISGVGSKIEVRLHELGIFHFDQIAGWSEEQEQWVDNQLKFKGRIARDEWVKQAKLLAQGKEEEFASLYSGSVDRKGNRSRNSRTPQR